MGQCSFFYFIITNDRQMPLSQLPFKVRAWFYAKDPSIKNYFPMYIKQVNSASVTPALDIFNGNEWEVT